MARLLPELGGDQPHARTDPLSDAWQRRQFFDGLAHAVLAADPPTVLVLDDLQWCDAETQAWLQVLLHLGADAPVLVLATLRIEELPDQPDLASWYRRLQQADLLHQLDLAPLSAAETGELAHALGGEVLDPTAARRLANATGLGMFLSRALVVAIAVLVGGGRLAPDKVLVAAPSGTRAEVGA